MLTPSLRQSRPTPKDAISDSSTAEKRAIEDKYQAQIDAINSGADAEAEAQKEAADKVKPSAQNFLDGLLDNVEEAKRYGSLLTQIIQDVDDPTAMIEFFKSMKPEEATPLMEEIIAKGVEFKDDFNAALSEVGKVQETPLVDVWIAQMQGKMQQAKDQSKNFLKLITRLAQMGKHDLGTVLQEMVGQLGAEQAPAALASLINASDAQLTGVLEEWKHAGVGEWETVYGQMKIQAQAVTAAAQNDHGTLVARLKEITDPAQFLAALQEAGIDATVAGNFRTALNTAMEGVDEEGRRKWDEFKAYIEGRSINAFISYDVKYGQRLEELIANNPGLDPKVLKELNSAGYSQGSDSPGSGLAAGGKMHQGEPRLVGEKGPEMFMPNSSGFIISNQNLTKGIKRMSNMYREAAKVPAFGGQARPWNASQPRKAASGSDAKPIVVPLSAQHTTTFTGDINAGNLEDVVAYAERKKRHDNLTGV